MREIRTLDSVSPSGAARWLRWLFLWLLTGFILWVGATHTLELNDDSFITLAYVKSLAAGGGWRYNGGAETLGSTTPLFALIVAGLARLMPMIEIPRLAVGVDVAAWLGVVWLLALGHRTFRVSAWGGLVGAAALALPISGWQAALGMETPLLAAALLFSTWLAARGKAVAAGLLAGLLPLIRPEGAAMIPLLALWLAATSGQRRWQRLARYSGAVALPLALWTLYALPRFGNVLPNSALAKLGQGQGWPGLNFGERLIEQWLPTVALLFGSGPWLSLLWPLALVGLLALVWRRSALLLLVAWAAIFTAVYTLLGAPGYWWYGIPVLVTLQLLAAVAVEALAEQRRTVVRAAQAALAVALVAAFALFSVRAIRAEGGDPRAAPYRAVATWMTENTSADRTLAHVEIGYLGFYSENPIVDLAGLTDPRLLANASRLDMAANFWLTEPDYFLYHPSFGWLVDSIVTDPRFANHYQPVADFPWTSEPEMRLYEKRFAGSEAE
ncbi:MAG: hypothetical protein KDD73_02510 [Anaerolineales bacterium]|nr:hypothetical protein [Anaerolineales bacterium]MCB9128232.1 hypothetical protein [Ardenticatenales bacterium]